MVTSDAVYSYCYHWSGGALKGSDLRDWERRKMRTLWLKCTQASLCSYHQTLKKICLVITSPPFSQNPHVHNQPSHGPCLIVLQRVNNVSSGIKLPGLETSPGLTSYGFG